MKNSFTRQGYAQSCSPKGFTLIELLVVVIIIGVLAAIAVPQYQKAVLKSRFTAMMPIAKNLAAANEVYYAEHDRYALHQQDLNVTVQTNPSDGTEVELSADPDYAYVLASNPGVRNNTYVVYQNHSENFAGNTHCEAVTGNEQAEGLCIALGGTPLDGGISGAEYTAYLLSGSNTGTFEKQCKGSPETEQACECGANITREATCDTTTGEWEYGEWDGTCPDKPTEEEACGTGTKTRSVTCKADGSAWELGEWDISGCQLECPATKPATSRQCEKYSDFCGTQTRTVECDHTTGRWEVGPWQGVCRYIPTWRFEDDCYVTQSWCKNNSVVSKRERKVGYEISNTTSYQADSNCDSGCSSTQTRMECANPPGTHWVEKPFPEPTKCYPSSYICSYVVEGMVTND